MREILFREKKDDLPCVFVYGQLIVCDNGDCLISKCNHYGDTCYSNKVFPDTVGQYTGLTDKNGKKIFEGDILEYIDADGDKQHLSVGFEDGCFVYEEYIDGKKGYTECLNTVLMLDPEIVGNIYDNPELLEVSE